VEKESVTLWNISVINMLVCNTQVSALVEYKSVCNRNLSLLLVASDDDGSIEQGLQNQFGPKTRRFFSLKFDF
jgi:hypothetical protein